MKKIFFPLFTLSCFCASAQPFNGFIRFDGIDDMLTRSNMIPSSGDWTVEFWVKSCEDSLPSAQPFIVNSTNFYVYHWTTMSGITIYQPCNTSACYQDHQYPKNSDWHHLAVTYVDNTDKYEMYFDGLSGTYSPLSTDYTSYPILEVAYGPNPFWNFQHYAGYMDEMRISNVVRYNGFANVQTAPFTNDANTIGLWHFDELNPATLMYDSSSFNRDFTVVNNPFIFHSDSMQLTYTTAGSNFIYAAPYVSGTSSSWYVNDGVVVSSDDTVCTVQWNVPATDTQYIVHNYIDPMFSCPIWADTIGHAGASKSSMNEYGSHTALRVYPNPFDDYTIIELINSHSDAGEYTITIFSVLGNEVYSNQLKNRLVLNANALGKGTYFYSLIGDNGITYSGKLVVY
ncbi:MAG: LamG-like jellyroll fold domain-containing protein [Flavobacteriales bacterium]